MKIGGFAYGPPENRSYVFSVHSAGGGSSQGFSDLRTFGSAIEGMARFT